MKIALVSLIITILILSSFVVTGDIFSKNIESSAQEASDSIKDSIRSYIVNNYAKEVGRNQGLSKDFFRNQPLDMFFDQRTTLQNVNSFDVLYYNCSVEYCDTIVLDQSRNLSEQVSLDGQGYLYTGQKDNQSIILKIPWDIKGEPSLYLDISRDIEFFREYESELLSLLEDTTVSFYFRDMSLIQRIPKYLDGSFDKIMFDFFYNWPEEALRVSNLKKMIDTMNKIDIDISKNAYYYNKLEIIMPEFIVVNAKVQNRPFSPRNTIGSTLFYSKTPLDKANDRVSESLLPLLFSGAYTPGLTQESVFLDLIVGAYEGYSEQESPESQFLRLKTVYNLVFERSLGYCNIGEEFCIIEFTDCDSHEECLIDFILSQEDSAMCGVLSFDLSLACGNFFSATKIDDCTHIRDEYVKEKCIEVHSREI